MGFRKILLHTLLPLLIGLCIYLFLHKPNLIIHYYANKLVQFPNYYESTKNIALIKLVVNHIPDMLWACSLGIFLLYTIWFISNKYLKAAFILILLSLTEIVQVFYPKTFTFDWVDLGLIIITQLFIFFWYESKQKY
jgi:hypothetical protein